MFYQKIFKRQLLKNEVKLNFGLFINNVEINFIELHPIC